MKQLNYETLHTLPAHDFLLPTAPERVLQFGEGNFLRGFVDYFIDVANETLNFNGKVVLVQPIAAGMGDTINRQDGLYTLYLRGVEGGQQVSEKRIISCVSRCLNPYTQPQAVLDCAKNPDLRFIVSNTTEAGIVYDPSCKLLDNPPASFPAKLTQLLYHRYQDFGHQPNQGFVILSCELIDNNGRALKRCVLQHLEDWGLDGDFRRWVEEENIFCSTLVDRIVTGFPRGEIDALNQENGYVDNLVDTAEAFGLWVIEGPDSLKEELPFAQAGLPVLITQDHSPYKQRKVRILNGAHTSMVLAAYLAGEDFVRGCMEDKIISAFMRETVFQEIIPTLTLPREELLDFAAAVQDRFQNPFIQHSLLSISLNSVSKWRARVLPSLRGYVSQFGTLPPCITLSFAALVAFYRCQRREDGRYVACRPKGDVYTLQDDQEVLDFFAQYFEYSDRQLIAAVASHTQFWGEDLTHYPGFLEQVTTQLDDIRRLGARGAMASCLKEHTPCT